VIHVQRITQINVIDPNLQRCNMLRSVSKLPPSSFTHTQMEKSAFVLVHGFGFCAAFHAASSSIWSGSVRTESAYGGTMSRETVAPLNAKLYLLPAHRRSRQRSMTVLEGTAYVRTSEWLNFVVATSIQFSPGVAVWPCRGF
jgi:hypothetical protein